jgi:hypothetical protein
MPAAAHHKLRTPLMTLATIARLLNVFGHFSNYLSG